MLTQKNARLNLSLGVVWVNHFKVQRCHKLFKFGNNNIWNVVAITENVLFFLLIILCWIFIPWLFSWLFFSFKILFLISLSMGKLPVCPRSWWSQFVFRYCRWLPCMAGSVLTQQRKAQCDAITIYSLACCRNCITWYYPMCMSFFFFSFFAWFVCVCWLFFFSP